MKGIITGTSQEGMLFIKATELGEVVKAGMEVEISVSVKTTVEPKKKDDVLVFNFEDCYGNTHTIKITEKQYKFLEELTSLSSGGYIDLDTWEEGYPDEDDLTDMC
jgi:hypothetical protein